MKTNSDVLDSPEVQRFTRAVLALKKKADDASAGLAVILADLGDQLSAAKAAIQKIRYGLWLPWLSQHVKFTAQTADNYMRVARLRRTLKINFQSFARLGVTALYEIAALPERLIHRLARDPRLPNPKTGQLTPIEELDERTLKRAIALYKGRRNPKHASKPGKDQTREELAREAIKMLRDAMAAMEIVRQGADKLSAETKRAMLDEIDDARKIALHWPAWVTPQKHRR